MPNSIAPELLAAQFEGAPFPFWLVDDQLAIVVVNRTAREQYPAHCLTDGVRLFLSPHAVDETKTAIAAGMSVVKRLAAGLPNGLSLSFTPWESPTGSMGALVMVIPAIVEPQVDDDLRRNLENVGNLVVSQGMRRCAGDILASLSAANSQLRAAGVGVADSQLQSINHYCYRLMRAAGNVAGTTQLTAGLPQSAQPVNFWDCCAELMEAVGTLLRGTGRRFVYSLPDSNLYVECDWDTLASALLNIFSNSCLYGGDTVQVTVTGRDMGGRVHLTIADNGPGIPERIQQRLFQPFCSWDCLDFDNAGMGLGLYLVRSIVTAAGGTVTLNTTGEGATVALSLPICDPPFGSVNMNSTSAEYMQDRYSPVYVALCDAILPPAL